MSRHLYSVLAKFSLRKTSGHILDKSTFSATFDAQVRTEEEKERFLLRCLFVIITFAVVTANSWGKQPI